VNFWNYKFEREIKARYIQAEQEVMITSKCTEITFRSIAIHFNVILMLS